MSEPSHIIVAAERARLGKDLAAAHKELSDAEAKLANPKFTERQPTWCPAPMDGATPLMPTSNASKRR